VSRRLLKLADVARKIAQREDYAVRAADEGGDEIGVLADAFNRMLAEIGRRSDPPDVETAIRRYREATMMATDLGMRPLAAHCHLGLGKLYRRTGKREQAQEHFITATTMYREMGMMYWLERTEAEQAELA